MNALMRLVYFVFRPLDRLTPENRLAVAILTGAAPFVYLIVRFG